MIVEVWHADSLAGPIGELANAFEEKYPDAGINTVSGRSRELAERIVAGEVCDVFVSSDPAVVEEMFAATTGGRAAASWYVVFSANELVVVTSKGNPCGIHGMADLARQGVRLARVTGRKDMATDRTVEFINRAALSEGRQELSQKIIEKAVGENAIQDVLAAVRSGRVDAGVVYLSSAVSAAGFVDVISFPSPVNLSENIRNAATIPGTAGNETMATGFVRLLLSADGQRILKKNGQPPIVPPIVQGSPPHDIAAFLRSPLPDSFQTSDT